MGISTSTLAKRSPSVAVDAKGFYGLESPILLIKLLMSYLIHPISGQETPVLALVATPSAAVTHLFLHEALDGVEAAEGEAIETRIIA